MAGKAEDVEVDGRLVRISNRDKVLFPDTGTTKGQIIDYYLNVASVLIDHLGGRPLTLKRYPDGVEGQFFYEKNCPKHAPEWVAKVPVQTSSRLIHYCVVDSPATVAWVANLASLELHPLLSMADDMNTPTKVTFDLDPGAPADIVDCAVVATELRSLLSELGLECFPKTSGSKGMQVEVPLNDGEVDFRATKTFARAVAQILEKAMPDRVVASMDTKLRKNKVFIDWSQNDANKTTICAYSVRAKQRPTVSTPVAWDEVGSCATGGVLSFDIDDVVARLDEFGDVAEPVVKKHQLLPRLEELGAEAGDAAQRTKKPQSRKR